MNSFPLTHFDPKFQGFNRPQKPSFNRQDLQLVFGADDSAETLRSILEERFFVMKNLDFFDWKR